MSDSKSPTKLNEAFQFITKDLEPFKKDLAELINKHSLEGVFGDTPDFILAELVVYQLFTHAIITRARDTFKTPTKP